MSDEDHEVKQCTSRLNLAVQWDSLAFEYLKHKTWLRVLLLSNCFLCQRKKMEKNKEVCRESRWHPPTLCGLQRGGTAKASWSPWSSWSSLVSSATTCPISHCVRVDLQSTAFMTPGQSTKHCRLKYEDAHSDSFYGKIWTVKNKWCLPLMCAKTFLPPTGQPQVAIKYLPVPASMVRNQVGGEQESKQAILEKSVLL